MALTTEQIEDIFDLLHFRSLDPMQAPIDSIEFRHVGMYVIAATDQSFTWGTIKRIHGEKVVLEQESGARVEAHFETCVLVH